MVGNRKSIRTTTGRLVAVSVAAGVMFAVGCATEPEPEPQRNLSGFWSGTASFSSQGRSTSMNISQSGPAVSGTFTLAGSVRDAPLFGELDDLGRLVWAAANGCDIWAGTLSMSADGLELTGPLLLDRSGCVPAQSNTTATLRLSR